MVDISGDYERFLLANFPDIYRRATADGVEEDVITSIKSRLAKEYKIWCSVPEWIKVEYRDNLPDDVLNGNRTVRQFIADEVQADKVTPTDVEDVNLFSNVSAGIVGSMLALGYSEQAVEVLCENRTLRSNLTEIMRSGVPLTEEQKQAWRQSRESDRDTIARDWEKNQPEKAMMHLSKKLSRLLGRIEGAETEEEIAAGEMKKLSMVRKLRELSVCLEDPKKREDFIRYFSEVPQQAALGHMNSEAVGILMGVLAECGIRIEARVNEDRDNELDRGDLAYDLREQRDDGKDARSVANGYLAGPSFGRSGNQKVVPANVRKGKERGDATV